MSKGDELVDRRRSRPTVAASKLATRAFEQDAQTLLKRERRLREILWRPRRGSQELH